MILIGEGVGRIDREAGIGGQLLNKMQMETSKVKLLREILIGEGGFVVDVEEFVDKSIAEDAQGDVGGEHLGRKVGKVDECRIVIEEDAHGDIGSNVVA